MTDERRARLLSNLVPFFAGVAYVLTAARTVLGGDNGEFAALGAVGGVGHPPGYPLYVLLLRAFAWLPASSPAHRSALVTSIVGALAVASLAWAARAWGASRLSASFVAGLFAFGPLAWAMATHAEVFALNVLLAMMLIGLAAPSRSASGLGLGVGVVRPLGEVVARASAIGFVVGLGLSNHHTIVLLAPVAIVGIATALVRSKARRVRWAVIVFISTTLGMCVGLLPYAYVLVRARAATDLDACTWGDPKTFTSLVAHFLRTDYGTFQLGISSDEPEVGAHLLALLERLFFDLCGAPFILVVGLIAAIRARDRAHGLRHYVPLGALVTSFVLSGPVFVSRFNLPPRGLAAHVTQRFHLLPIAVACVILALAIDACIRSSSSPRIGVIFARAAPALLLMRMAISYPDVRAHHRPTTELYVRNVLGMVPDRSILIGSGDDVFGGFMYARCALGLRPDVELIAPRMLLTSWYPPRVDARLGITTVRASLNEKTGRRVLPAKALVDQLLATGRPIFVTDWFAQGLDRSTLSYPIGPLIRLIPHEADVPDPESLAAQNERVFARMEFEPTLPEKDTWGGTRITDYARPWIVLERAFAARGSYDRAEESRRRALSFTP